MPLADDLFEATTILPEQARQVYPLVRLFHPAMSLDQWLAFSRWWARMPPHQGGLLAIKDRRGYVHAIFSYRVDFHLRHGPVLRLSDLIVGRLPGQIIDLAVVRKAEWLAFGVGCRVVVFELTQSKDGNIDPANRSALEKAGYVPCSTSFLRGKCVAASAIPSFPR